MIDINALFSISYGMYIVCSGKEEKANGYVSNTVFQVSSSPPLFATCCNKENHTASLIRNSGLFSVSVISQEAGSNIIGTFGYKSGKDIDKMSGINLKYGESGVAIVMNDSIAFLECRVVDTVDVGSHLMFIGELLQAQVLKNEEDPLTYQYYREVKKGRAPKNAPTYVDKSKAKMEKKGERWECSACGFIYEEDKEGKPFGKEPDDWTCPVCGVGKDDFDKL